MSSRETEPSKRCGRHRRALLWSAASGIAVAASLALCLWPLSSATASAPREPNGQSGFSYWKDSRPEVPWSVHVVRVDWHDPEFEIQTTLGGGTNLGMSLVSQQVQKWPLELGRPLAAVNGDFYHNHPRYRGDPMGTQIHCGELVSAPADRVCFWIDAQGQPHATNLQVAFEVTWPNGTRTPFGLNQARSENTAVLYTARNGDSTRAKGGLEFVLTHTGTGEWLPLAAGKVYEATIREISTNGNTRLSPDALVLSVAPALAAKLPRFNTNDVLRISTKTTPDLSGARMAVGAMPTLVRNGKPAERSGLQPRHPRSALGWNATHIFLVEVDGRQRNLSVGMSFPELADYMHKLGCTDAVNLDGGGSATMWVLGNLVSSPSEGRERPSANAVIVVKKAEKVESPVD